MRNKKLVNNILKVFLQIDTLIIIPAHLYCLTVQRVALQLIALLRKSTLKLI